MDSGEASRPYERSRLLEKELVEAGLPEELADPPFSPLRGVQILINGRQHGLSSKPYQDILLRYLDDTDETLHEAVVRALTEKQCRVAAESIIRLFDRAPRLGDSVLWAAANALHVFNDPSTYPRVLSIARRRDLGMSRQMLMDLLARMRNEESFEVLVELLDDKTVRGHVISALGASGDVQAISFIERTEVTEPHETRAKNAALKRLYQLKKQQLE
jgi:HEAT repeat protein